MEDEMIVGDEQSSESKSPRRRLTRSAQQDFLSHLAATAHVAMSAEVANVGVRAIYKLRQRDAAFAMKWREALLVGYERIEAALIRKALGLKDHAPVAASMDGELEFGEIDVSVAVMLLDRHRAAVAKVARETDGAAFRASRDSAESTLLAKLQAHGRRAAARIGADPKAGAAMACPVEPSGPLVEQADA